MVCRGSRASSQRRGALRRGNSANARTIPARDRSCPDRNAIWYPLMSELCDRRDAKPAALLCGSAAMVLSTASPSAPLICWETFVMPEPSPASAAGTSAIAIVSKWHERVADPETDRKASEEDRGEEGGVRSDGAEEEQPDDQRWPSRRRAPASDPKRADQPGGDAAGEDRHGDGPRQERGAGLKGAVVADVLEVERAQEERRVHAR